MSEVVPLWRNKAFQLLWVGSAASQLGTELTRLAMPLLVLAVTGSPGLAGVVAAARAVALIATQLPAGVWVDRWDRRRTLLAAQGTQTVNAAGLAALILTGHTPIWALVLFALIDGAGAAFTAPARTTAIRGVVPRDQLRGAYAQEEARSHAARLAGPPLGGLLYGLGRAFPFVADAITYLIAFLCALLAKVPRHPPTADSHPEPTTKPPPAPNTKPPREADPEASHGLGMEPPHGLDAGLSHRPDVEPPHGPDAEPSHRPDAEPPHGLDAEPSHRPDVEPPHGPGAEPSHRLDAERSHGPDAEAVPGARGRGGNMRGDLTAAVRWLWGRRGLRGIMGVALALNLVGGGFSLPLIVMIGERGGGPLTAGVVLAALGVGGIIGSLMSGRLGGLLPAGRWAILLSAVLGLANLAMALPFGPWWPMVPLLVVSLVVPVFNVVTNVAVVREVPEHMLGRMDSVYVVAAMGLSPLGPVLGGTLAATLGGAGALSTLGILFLLVAAAATTNRELRSPR